VVSNGLSGSQQEQPAKSSTASRWHLGVEQTEVDEDFGLLFFSSTELVRRVGLARWAGSMALAHWLVSLFSVSFPFLFSVSCFLDLI
jgi:hypothetical protein